MIVAVESLDRGWGRPPYSSGNTHICSYGTRKQILNPGVYSSYVYFILVKPEEVQETSPRYTVDRDHILSNFLLLL